MRHTILAFLLFAVTNVGADVVAASSESTCLLTAARLTKLSLHGNENLSVLSAVSSEPVAAHANVEVFNVKNATQVNSETGNCKQTSDANVYTEIAKRLNEVDATRVGAKDREALKACAKANATLFAPIQAAAKHILAPWAGTTDPKPQPGKTDTAPE